MIRDILYWLGLCALSFGAGFVVAFFIGSMRRRLWETFEKLFVVAVIRIF